MYVIAEIAGQQFKVEKGRKLYVHRLKGEEGSSLSFDKILLTDNDGQVNVGTPVIEGASINATILKHLKDDKVIVFKKKRRKGYRVKNGHRQFLTQILIDDIIIA
ncbi:MAG: 50S ribosomal protein L21 [Rikenellaceae bacterium]